MSTNPNVPFILNIAVELVVGAIIKKGGTPAAEAQRAQTVLAVNAALTEVVNGDTTAGLGALQTALAPSATTDPATAAEIQTAISFITLKLGAVQNLAGGTLLGTLNTQLFGQVVSAANSVAQAYISAAGTTPAPAA